MSMEHRTIDKLNQHYTAEGKIMKQNSINELMISYKIKGEQNESMVLYDAKSHTFCHVISDIITDSVIKNEQDMNEGDMDRNILIPRRVVFVIDKSGSMSGGKWTKTISATITAIKQLRKGYDRYCVLFFNRNVTCVPMDDIVLATEDNISKTITILQGTSASGGTNINASLLEAIERIKEDIKSCQDTAKDGYNFYINQILLITDGEPNSGERDPHKIISNVKNANHLKDIDPHTSKISIFSFGVGTDSNDSSWIKDLNHSFLKLLSVNNNGFYQRIKSSHTDTALTAYFNILSTPVLFNIDVQYNHKNIEQLSKTTFHTLYAGNDIIICGKMDAGDDTAKQLCLDLTITATTAKTMRTANGDRCITKPVDICKQMKVNIEMETHDDPQGNDNHIERIWAYLKLQEFAKTKLIYNDLIEVSEDEKRNDDALPLSLAMKYKFVTPWTSMIVVKKKEEDIANVQAPPLTTKQTHSHMIGDQTNATKQARTKQYSFTQGFQQSTTAYKRSAAKRGSFYNMAPQPKNMCHGNALGLPQFGGAPPPPNPMVGMSGQGFGGMPPRMGMGGAPGGMSAPINGMQMGGSTPDMMGGMAMNGMSMPMPAFGGPMGGVGGPPMGGQFGGSPPSNSGFGGMMGAPMGGFGGMPPNMGGMSGPMGFGGPPPPPMSGPMGGLGGPMGFGCMPPIMGGMSGPMSDPMGAPMGGFGGMPPNMGGMSGPMGFGGPPPPPMSGPMGGLGGPMGFGCMPPIMGGMSGPMSDPMGAPMGGFGGMPMGGFFGGPAETSHKKILLHRHSIATSVRDR
eukprot:599454_1